MPEQITILVDSSVIELNTKAFFDKARLRSIYRLFKWMFQEACRNGEAISAVYEYLKISLGQAKTKTQRKRYYKIATAFKAEKSKYNVKEIETYVSEHSDKSIDR